MTDDRKLKLRMYGRYDFDEIEGQRRQRYGLGVGYRTEFGTLADFKHLHKYSKLLPSGLLGPVLLQVNVKN